MDTLTVILDLMQTKKCDNQTLAAALNLNRQVVTDWRAGRSKSYTKYLPQIADYFGVSVDYLLGKTEQKEKPSPEGESYEENVIILHRDGKTTVRKYTKEQLDAIEAMLNQIGGSDS